jgi:hypothetical protein
VRYDRFVAHTVCRCLVALALASGVATGYEQTLDQRAIDEALALGHSRVELVKLRFHQPYRLAVGRPPVDYVEIVTPFRRVELLAEERTRVGDRLLGQREVLAALAGRQDRLDLVVELTFHPLNNYVGVPSYDVVFARPGSGTGIEPADIQRIPRFGSRIEGLPDPYATAPSVPSGSQPMLGGAIVAGFVTRLLDPDGVYDVVVRDAGKELARVRAELGKMR